MLGQANNPELLVDVDQEFSPTTFDFHVINGRWDGTFTDGYITVWNPPSGSFTSLDKLIVLCDNQDRLRGDYIDVFNNFHDENYVALKPKPVKYPANWDDDIAF